LACETKTMSGSIDYYGAEATLPTDVGDFRIFRLDALEKEGLTKLHYLPYSIRILLESLLRQQDGNEITSSHVADLAAWSAQANSRSDIPFLPARVIMQDFTGVPALVDLAAMRSALARLGGDPSAINPVIPVDLVIDHSVQVDFFASRQSLARNADIEFQRNRERYEFLRWGKEAFDNFRVVPPATGIVHQVNLEFLASVVQTMEADGQAIAFPDSLVGTDSHTTMINGLGVLGWGVGGIEAEAAILGKPLVMIAPDVIGFRLTGELADGATATDLVLRVTQILRRHGVVGKFVEFYGSGLSTMSLPDRATISNMAPEYGATVGFFPVDQETLRYLRLTGRDESLVKLVEQYCRQQHLFRTDDAPEPAYTQTIELDLASVETSLAGPKRPQDRIALADMKSSFQSTLMADVSEGGFGLEQGELARQIPISENGQSKELGHGAVVIAAITSCTNTSNPSVMVAAGLLAKNAVERGLKPYSHVKTSLAPGSRVVTDYLEQANLLEPLAQLGFNIVGYGCTTCIGNSGPLPAEVVKAISEGDLVAASVLSGNRNFEGRINPHVRANYLASPPLVVAYALVGTVDINLRDDPLGNDQNGEPVFLSEIWPSPTHVQAIIDQTIGPHMFNERYGDVFSGNETWNAIPISGGELYEWSQDSTYIQEPPFFVDLTAQLPEIKDIAGARILAILGDSITTDHISPAGAIPAEGPAGKYLIDKGVSPRYFNSFGSRRGNDRLMTRGTFGNIRIKNLLLPGVEGGETIHFPEGDRMSIFEAASRYQEQNTPLLVLAGKEYGAGSSRDWAAKGTLLLGVKAVLAKSFERIHRSNLVGMGVLPLQFMPGEGWEELGLAGDERFDVQAIERNLTPGGQVTVRATSDSGQVNEFKALIRVDTPAEIEYYRHGGILHMVLREMLEAG
jgi:aconitate hydratase